jgi:hypothetical protein
MEDCDCEKSRHMVCFCSIQTSTQSYTEAPRSINRSESRRDEGGARRVGVVVTLTVALEDLGEKS